MSTVQLPDETRSAGDTWPISVELAGVDWSGATFKAEVRRSENHFSDLLATWTIDSVVYDAVNNKTVLSMSLTADETRAIGNAKRGFWDLQMTLNGTVSTVVRQRCEPTQDVTI